MEFLYRVMEALSNSGVPIVFKGAMVLNLVIKENNPSRAVREIDSSLDVQVNRIFGERKSAGFKIINENREKIASIDLSVRHDKMKGIKNKPNFAEVYNRVRDVVNRFES